MVIKAIIFDCFGVLTGDKWKEFVHSLPDGQREPARELNRALDCADLSFDEFLRQMRELTGRSTEDVAGVINAEMYKDEALLGYIASLKPQYKIGLLSNVSTAWIRTTLLSTEELGLFDDQVLSYEVHMVKPNPKIYELSARNLGVEIGECVLVDDSIRNCKGAKQAGMQAILYQDIDQFKTELGRLLAANSNH